MKKARLSIFFLFSAILLTTLLPNRLYSETEKLDSRTNIGIGVIGGLGPAVLGFDYEGKSIYGFVSGSILMPFLIFGSEGGSSFFAFSVGVAKSIKISKASNWKFDFIGILTPGYIYGLKIAFGLGVGFHATFDTGFTIGFKLPILGLAIGEYPNYFPFMVSEFYLMNFFGTPIVSFGYRF